MNHPKTLLNLAGSEPPVAQFSNTVLVLIDAQNEYVSGPVQLPDIEAATTAAKRLLSAVRKVNGKVIHIVHRGSPGGLFADIISRLNHGCFEA